MQEEELSPEELSALLTSYMPDIPGYRVLRRIGKGGMSQVYLGVQESLDRQVAIKVMSPEALADEVSKQRFEQEARTIAKLEHPCIVGIHEVGRSHQGLMYYVLPYLAKGHLGQRDFTNDEARTFEVLRALLSALEYAHARGIVHRDVKAENVLFDNADRPLLTDFGIALSKKDNTRITTAGLAVGSGGYMPPEQARGEAVDGRADLYSVGVLAYELVTGRLPYLANDALKARNDESAKTIYQRAEKFATDLDRKKGKSWLALRNGLPALLVARLEKDTNELNRDGITNTKALAAKFSIEAKLLEPAWSKANALPQIRAGDILKAAGPSMVLSSAPTAGRAGLAVMREEVSKGEYAAFAAATNRAAPVCRNAFASIFSGKISWDKPGFNQSNEHPVVCISHADARAYAQWLSKRTGINYRLPTQSEWRSVAVYRAGDPCRAGVISCGNKGTAAGSGTPSSPLGIYDLQGNASEWLNDSAGSGKFVVAGLSWRDASSASSTRTSNQNGDRGYDDVGFRLVREVSLSDLVK